MTNPVVVEVLRGEWVESAHCGAGAVVDADGEIVFAFGDIDRPIYPRSAVKAIQALPLIESGAADRLGLSDVEIALACASHSGEEAHVAIAAGTLAKAGQDESVLECGSHWPFAETAARDLARAGRNPGPLHNNCSGKHAGFVCVASAFGIEPKGYVGWDHPVQRRVREALADVTGARLDETTRAVDGCSIPTYATPLRLLAQGFARFATGRGLPSDRARAAARILAAVAAHPWAVAGPGRFDTEVMSVSGARAFTKSGAEGAYCAALPERGVGIAVKADDGGGRAAQAMVTALIRRFGGFDEALKARLSPYLAPRIRNWRGLDVGAIRPAGPLAESPRD